MKKSQKTLIEGSQVTVTVGLIKYYVIDMYIPRRQPRKLGFKMRYTYVTIGHYQDQKQLLIERWKCVECVHLGSHMMLESG